MWAGDKASPALGMELVSVGPGTAVLAMRVRETMVNGLDVCHGGFIFTLADSACAFASNSYNRRALLQSGQITGAGLDVYEQEPIVPAALIAMHNVTLLPHLGTAALEVRAAMGMMAVDNLKAFFAGLPPPNGV